MNINKGARDAGTGGAGAYNRKKTRRLMVGNVQVGDYAPVSVQSMTNTLTSDVAATVGQIKALESAGCEIIRVAVPDEASANAIREIKREISIPLIADIHFDWRLALSSLEAGADCLRLNPGNIGARERIRAVVVEAGQRGAPIRIGVNAGSLEKDILAEYGEPTPEALVKSALRHIRILEDEGFGAIKVSIKASSVPVTIAAYRMLSATVDYPMHVGITEAGTAYAGTIKSAAGIGALLAQGIGDTLRVSLTGDPVEEVRVGWEILKALELRQRGVVVVSCPTCGRVKFDCAGVALEIERRLASIREPVTVAVMGCVVNGPGEARGADVGVAGGDGLGLVYVKGEPKAKVSEERLVDVVVDEVMRIVEERRIGGVMR